MRLKYEPSSDRYSSQCKNNYFVPQVMNLPYLRLIYFVSLISRLGSNKEEEVGKQLRPIPIIYREALPQAWGFLFLVAVFWFLVVEFRVLVFGVRFLGFGCLFVDFSFDDLMSSPAFWNPRPESGLRLWFYAEVTRAWNAWTWVLIRCKTLLIRYTPLLIRYTTLLIRCKHFYYDIKHF